jgi:hypothetical protein
MLQKIGKIVLSQDTGEPSLGLLNEDNTSGENTGGGNAGGDPGVIIFDNLKKDLAMLERLWQISNGADFTPTSAGFAQQEVVRHIAEMKGLLNQVLYLTLNNQTGQRRQ